MPAVSPRAPSLREARGEAMNDALGERSHLPLHEGLRLAAAGLHLTLRLAAVALDDASRLGAALAQLALDLGAGALDLTQRAVASGVATALELAQVGRDATSDLVELTLSARAGGGVRLDGLDDLVAGGESGANRNQHGALGLRLDDLKRVQLGLGAGLSGPAGGLAAPGGVAPAGGSGLAGRGLPLSLCLGALSGSHGVLSTLLPDGSGLHRGSY